MNQNNRAQDDAVADEINEYRRRKMEDVKKLEAELEELKQENASLRLELDYERGAE